MHKDTGHLVNYKRKQKEIQSLAEKLPAGELKTAKEKQLNELAGAIADIEATNKEKPPK